MLDWSVVTDCLPLRAVLKQAFLRDYQVLAALKMACLGRQLLIFNTGLGKTLAAVAGIQMLFNGKKSKKVLWIGPLATMEQVAADIKSETNLRYFALRGEQTNISSFLRKDLSGADILLVNLEAFDNPDVVRIFQSFSMTNTFDAIIIDEAHLIANPFYSNRNSFIYMLAYRIRSCFLLTATPIISNIQQYASLIALVTKDLQNLFSIRHKVHQGEYKPERVPDLVSYKTRDTIVPVQIFVVPSELDIDRAPGTLLFAYTRGPNAKDINTKLLDLIRQKGKKRFLIHCHLTRHHHFLRQLLLTELGLKAGIASSATPCIKTVQEQLHRGEIDCLIFSLTTGLNFPAEYVVMYDWTIYAAQAIGRGLRTEEVNNYAAYFLIAGVEKEISFFQNTVMKNGLLTEKALGYSPLSLIRGEVRL